ncbi:hypothetical protein BH09BAC1_BH09BAC1_17140 [soil metagenome]
MGKPLAKPIILFIYLLFCFNCLGQTSSLAWAKQFTGSDSAFGNGIEVDDSGNVYIAGNFRGTIDFDPGPNSYYLSAVGVQDAFVCKLDVDGNLVWAVQLGGISEESAEDLAIDGDGNVYTAYNDILNQNNTTIIKLDRQGNLMWSKETGGDGVISITVDSTGSLFATGLFHTAGDFDPGTGVFVLAPVGFTDVFFLKLDPDGNFAWAKQITSTTTLNVWGIAVDTKGYVYLTGSFYHTADFDPGIGIYNLSAPVIPHAYIAKYDSLGNLVWAEQTGRSLCYGLNLAVDDIGNVYYTGLFGDTVDFDPGPGVFELESYDYSLDIFVSKLDTDGNFLWARQLGGPNDYESCGIALDTAGNVYTTGYFSVSADFDPGQDTFTLQGAWANIYISKLDKNGNFLSASAIAGYYEDIAYEIAVDKIGNTYTTGIYHIQGDFDPGVDTFLLVAARDTVENVFVLKLRPCINSFTIIDTASCVYYVSPIGRLLTITGTYKDTLTNGTGCDSIITINLTINKPNATIIANNDTLTSNTTGAAYQWVMCTDTGYADIAGANSQSYVPIETGEYGLIITQQGCSNTTSSCIAFTRVGISALNKPLNIQAHPNPTNGDFGLKLGQVYNQVNVVVMDVAGRVVSVNNYALVDHIDLTLIGGAAMYIIKITANDSLPSVLRMVKTE